MSVSDYLDSDDRPKAASGAVCVPFEWLRDVDHAVDAWNLRNGIKPWPTMRQMIAMSAKAGRKQKEAR